MEELAQYSDRKINQDSMRPYAESGYRHPTAEDVTALRMSFGLSMADMAQLVGVDETLCESWAAPEGEAIPYAAWRLLLIETRKIRWPLC